MKHCGLLWLCANVEPRKNIIRLPLTLHVCTHIFYANSCRIEDDDDAHADKAVYATRQDADNKILQKYHHPTFLSGENAQLHFID